MDRNDALENFIFYLVRHVRFIIIYYYTKKNFG